MKFILLILTLICFGQFAYSQTATDLLIERLSPSQNSLTDTSIFTPNFGTETKLENSVTNGMKNIWIEPSKKFFSEGNNSNFSTMNNSYILRGGSSDGGGKGILCTNEKGESRVFLADTFSTRFNKAYPFENDYDSSFVISAVAEVLEDIFPRKVFTASSLGSPKISLSEKFVLEHEKLDFEISSETLPDLPDDFIDPKTLPPICELVQVAIQNIPSGKVRVDSKLASQMSFLDRGLLEVHETFIRLRNQPGEDTTPIRNEVENIVKTLDNRAGSFADLINCKVKTERIRQRISYVKSLKNRDEKFCEQAFDISNQIIFYNAILNGFGYSKAKPAAVLEKCSNEMIDLLEQEFLPLEEVKRICQPVVNKHLIACDIGQRGDEWIENYLFGMKPFEIDTGEICIWK